jgi:hypothetical protein
MGNNDKILRTSEPEPQDGVEFNNILFPMVIKVMASTLSNDLIFASEEDLDRVKNRVITENRDASIDSIINGTECVNKKLEDDEEYKELSAKGVVPLASPKCNLMYMDLKYNNDESE